MFHDPSISDCGIEVIHIPDHPDQTKFSFMNESNPYPVGSDDWHALDAFMPW
jgi:hypothetical protein